MLVLFYTTLVRIDIKMKVIYIYKDRISNVVEIEKAPKYEMENIIDLRGQNHFIE